MPSIARSLAAVTFLLIVATPALAQKKTLTFEQVGGKGERISFGATAPARWSDGLVSIREGEGRVLLDPNTLAPVTGTPPSRPAKPAAPAPEPGSRRGKLEYEPSPDGTLAAFVRKEAGGEDGAENLIVEDAAGGNPWAVTEVREPGFLFGRLDWVYQEEVYGRGNFKGFWWSPDSKWIAFLGLDERAVKDFVVIDHVPASLDKDKTVETERTRYPKAGDPNPTVTLGLADVAAKTSSFVTLDGYEKDIIIARVAWDPAGALIVQIQNRIQSWLDVVRIDPKTAKPERLFRDESKQWVEVIGQPHWLKDGSFLWLSDRTGFRHVYHYDKSGKVARAVTQGEWAVRDIDFVDEEGGFIYFSATKDGAVGNNLYRAPLAGGDVVRLTQGRGTHTVSWSGDHQFFIDSVSSLDSPVSQTLHKADGTKLKDLGKATVAALATHAYSQPRLVEYAARDGFILDAMVIAPLVHEAGTTHPVWIETYSGPDAPSVRDAWNGSTWFQFLAHSGYYVLQVNVRTASGKGYCTTSKCYRQFGVSELMDLEDGLGAFLKANPDADPARVGIHGWSYGGFMTGYALTHSTMFRLGVAGAGVYDWRLYDTIYTERYMDTPQNNAEGYKKTSCLEAAGQLSGHLVLVHGTMDDNVHFQNTVRFAYELQKADKQFDVMIYPKSRHGLGSAQQNWHLKQLIWRYMQAELGGPMKKG